MPVQRFRGVEEMPRPPLVTGPTLVRRIRAVWRRARLFAPPRTRVRGVRRFRSIAEADAARGR